MDHSKSRKLQTKRMDKVMRSYPGDLEKQVCKREKAYRIDQILDYCPGKYTREELERKNLNRIRDIYDSI